MSSWRFLTAAIGCTPYPQDGVLLTVARAVTLHRLSRQTTSKPGTNPGREPYCWPMSSNVGLRPRALEVSPHRWMRWLWLPAVFILLAIGLWWLGHPQELAAPDRTATASTKAGRTLYLGVTDASQRGRDLQINEIDIPKPSSGDATVKAWVCVDGSIAATTDPTRFCSDVVTAKGHDLRLGTDQLMISIDADSAQKVKVARLTVSYREGLQRAEQPVGPVYAVAFVD